MFKQYLRYANGQPFAVVVLDGTNFGYSICNPVDRFDKKKALLVAEGRAKTGRDWIFELKDKVTHGFIPFKHRILLRRGKAICGCASRLIAVIDKMEYLKNKLLKQGNGAIGSSYESES